MTADADPAMHADAKLKDDQFYFTLLTFEVEDILFRVPRRPFESESEVFKDMFGIPTPADSLVDGSSDEQPITLQGITAVDFRAFLRVLFDPAHGTQSDLSQNEWTSVLRLAHMWNCNRLFALAVTKLDKYAIEPIPKITLAKAYNITDWLRPAFFQLAMRPEPLTLEEANELGMDTVVKLSEVRELRYRWIVDDLETDIPRQRILTPSPFPRKASKGKKSLSALSKAVDLREHVKEEWRLEVAVNKAITKAFCLEDETGSITSDNGPVPEVLKEKENVPAEEWW